MLSGRSLRLWRRQAWFRLFCPAMSKNSGQACGALAEERQQLVFEPGAGKAHLRAQDAERTDDCATGVKDRRSNLHHTGIMLLIIDGVALATHLIQFVVQQARISNCAGCMTFHLGA